MKCCVVILFQITLMLSSLFGTNYFLRAECPAEIECHDTGARVDDGDLNAGKVARATSSGLVGGGDGKKS